MSNVVEWIRSRRSWEWRCQMSVWSEPQQHRRSLQWALQCSVIRSVSRSL